MYIFQKWPEKLQKSCDAHTARFLKYVVSFFNSMHERLNAGLLLLF